MRHLRTPFSLILLCSLLVATALFAFLRSSVGIASAESSANAVVTVGKGRVQRTPAALLGALVSQPLVPGQHSVGEYVVGDYPNAASAPDPEAYARPRTLLEVTATTRLRPVSEFFTLGQFVCKQAGAWPKYLALQPALLNKLDALVVALQEQQFAAQTLHVMSGYRTPAYNRALGNVRFSRHIYGDAADVFVDTDENGVMDDLNGDGQVDIADAQWLAELAGSLSHDLEAQPLRAGGLGIYPGNSAHGPFLHIDTRGSQARWGHRH